MSVQSVQSVASVPVYPEIVNGYFCFSSGDVQAARSDIDPSTLHVKAQPSTANDRQSSIEHDKVAARNAGKTYGTNRPLSSGTRGRIVNIWA